MLTLTRIAPTTWPVAGALSLLQRRIRPSISFQRFLHHVRHDPIWRFPNGSELQQKLNGLIADPGLKDHLAHTLSTRKLNDGRIEEIVQRAIERNSLKDVDVPKIVAALKAAAKES